MSTNVKTNNMAFPYSMGKIIPGATFATACVPLTQNIVPVSNDGATPDTKFNGIYIQASPDNLLPMYVCSSVAAPDTSAYTNILGWLQPGEWFPRTKEWGNTRDLGALFLGAQNATDFAIVIIDAV